MDCKKLVEFVCSRNHKSSRLCFQNNVSCRICDNEDRVKELKRQREHKANSERERKRKEHAQQLADIERQIDQQKDILTDNTEDEQRHRVLEQRQRDLEHLKENVKNKGAIMIKEPGTGISKEIPVPSTSSRCVPYDKDNGTETQDNGNSKSVKSAAKDDWEFQKEFEGAQNEYIDTLTGMIGLEEVKQQFLSVKSRIDTSIRQGVDVQDERFGAILLGNPGTGNYTSIVS
jgi:DNA repair exonuclease SbcCD ATPase subunit